jgi:hypothetical protein
MEKIVLSYFYRVLRKMHLLHLPLPLLDGENTIIIFCSNSGHKMLTIHRIIQSSKILLLSLCYLALQSVTFFNCGALSSLSVVLFSYYPVFFPSSYNHPMIFILTSYPLFFIVPRLRTLEKLPSRVTTVARLRCLNSAFTPAFL